jgi:hypothetical protein
MDIDQWMRAYALVSLCSVGDTYTFGNNHNFFTYSRPSDGKFVFFPWDMDFAFSRGSSGALVGDQNLGKLVNLPGNLRRLYAHMLDIISVSFNPGYMSYWTDHYDNFGPGQSYAGSLSTITARVPFVTSAINSAGGNAAFAVSGTNSFSTNSSLITLSGTAPVAVQKILINGQEYALTWTSVSAWSVRVPVSGETNSLEITAYDLKGRPLTNLTRTVTVVYTGALSRAEDSLVINEIMYNPVTPEASYVEILNRADFAFDLSGWKLSGVDFTFPSGTYITNRGYLVVAKNPAVFANVYGTAIPLAGRFDGQLDDGGETIALIRPGATPAEDVVVDRVKYDDDLPWPASPDGSGSALQLIDPAQDNSRVANWGDGSGWKFFSYTANVGASASTRLSLFFEQTGGDVYLDEMSLVFGNQPGVGPNVLVNGGFESGLTGWGRGPQGTNSTVVSDVTFSGTAALRLVVSAGAPSLTAFYQDFPQLVFSTNYTLSFWYRSGTAGTNLNMRINTAFRAIVNPAPVVFSPGSANPSFGGRAPFEPIWLNEVQPQNLTGPVDSQGEREPWIEIHNAGATPMSLDGFYLADNYTNLTQWAFPAGSVLQPGEFKVIVADGEPGESTASEWHTSFRLPAGSGSVALVRVPAGGGSEVVDFFNYTGIPAGRSYGAYPDGQPFERQEFYRVTRGSANDNTSAPIVAVINEWMAANSGTLLNTNNNNRFDDWFELYNPGATPVSLGGYYLTDNLNNKAQFLIPQGFTIPANGYLLVWADNIAGEALGLFASDGTMIDAVTFGSQFTDRSEGRVPNGTGPAYYLTTPTPAGPNTGWANRRPELTAVSDIIAVVGQPVTFTADATDPDGDALTFSLGTGAPLGATIQPATGAFSFTPSAPGTNVVVIQVADNGVPALTASRTVRITAITGLLISGGSAQVANGTLSFTVGTTAGKTYRIEYKESLNDAQWLPLGDDRVAGGTSLTITDPVGATPRRFYRVLELP